ncbi:radical SAM protein [Sporomusa acidovorans]|uniref:Radical SAM core domain-containing protein n=1 Tax=Sporomusa acidovorans (strain ATCC 49682 / DSM 3132 / Mol) TaxID=1123286 RepID=A0ABZ3J1Q0_SPOA4|nr:radical SAM protein [Sporomusa acidovorans]OZC24150.1 radical SAM superfamily protein [Sporomusa acidovorans DSM 3132]SDF37341.1 putative pyruvate formate lyase activating enzyme [Sporomusa acidovorans]
MDDYPGYLRGLADGTLQQAAKALMAELEDCVVCPHHCHVNRKAGELGYCQSGWNVEIGGYEPHFGEEPPLVGTYGSGTIFFSHCNLGCLFCQNWDISHEKGDKLSPEDLASIMLELQQAGCHNINLVSPSHYVPQIIAAVLHAAEKGLHIPLVYNTSGYDNKTTLERIDGIVDIYMPDFKYASSEIGKQLSCVSSYWKVTKAAVKEMHRQVGDLVIDEQGIAHRGLLIRHLVLPGNLAGTEQVMEFIAKEVSPTSYINIMDQYFPEFKAQQNPKLNRCITRAEFLQAVDAAKRASPFFRLIH